MLQLARAGRVLKPLDEGARSIRELAFYRRVFPEVPVPELGALTAPVGTLFPPTEDGGEDDYARLRAFLPQLHGVAHVPLVPDVPRHHIRHDVGHGRGDLT